MSSAKFTCGQEVERSTDPSPAQQHQQFFFPTRSSTNQPDKLQRELQLFKKHYSDFIKAVTDHNLFGAELFSKGLISDLEWKNVRSSPCSFTDIMCTLLDDVHSRLSTGLVRFESFLEVIANLEPSTASIAKSMQESLDKMDEAVTLRHPVAHTQRLRPSVDVHTPASKRLCLVPSILDHFMGEEDLEPTSTTNDPVIQELEQVGSSLDVPTEGDQKSIQDTLQSFLQDQDDIESPNDIESIPRSLSLLQPTGALTKRSHARIYTKLFKMAWNGQDQQAMTFVRTLRKQPSVSIDLKAVCMEVVHTVNSERDLKMLLTALAYTDRAECESKTILKCRLHRRIAGLHYRNGDLEEADEHLVTATQLAEHLSPDIDTVYTLRLNALMLFARYKDDNKDEASRKGAEKYFQLAMDHVKRLPDSKRLITERIKVSKALFHLDMRDLFTQNSKSEDAIEQLEYRAQDALNDVDETFMTDGDRAFFYSTQAQLKLCDRTEWDKAEEYASKAVELSSQCGLKDSLSYKNGTVIIDKIRNSRERTSDL